MGIKNASASPPQTTRQLTDVPSKTKTVAFELLFRRLLVLAAPLAAGRGNAGVAVAAASNKSVRPSRGGCADGAAL